MFLTQKYLFYQLTFPNFWYLPDFCSAKTHPCKWYKFLLWHNSFHFFHLCKVVAVRWLSRFQASFDKLQPYSDDKFAQLNCRLLSCLLNLNYQLQGCQRVFLNCHLDCYCHLQDCQMLLLFLRKNLGMNRRRLNWLCGIR